MRALASSLILLALVLAPWPGVHATSFVGVIAYVSGESGADDIWVMDLSTMQRMNLTNDTFKDQWPAWSPTGQKIAFVSDRTGNPDIYTMNSDGTGVQNLTNRRGLDSYPSWSPDGEEIVYTAQKGGVEQLWKRRADGTNRVQLTFIVGAIKGPRHPDWSPDGTSILFSMDVGIGLDIYVLELASGSIDRWPGSTLSSDHTTGWSPDSTLIAYHSHQKSRGRIFIAPRDGSTPERKTQCDLNRECDESPKWSPSGQWIAFHRNVFPQPRGNPPPQYKDLFLLDIATNTLVQLTNNGAILDCCPTWQP